MANYTYINSDINSMIEKSIKSINDSGADFFDLAVFDFSDIETAESIKIKNKLDSIVSDNGIVIAMFDDIDQFIKFAFLSRNYRSENSTSFKALSFIDNGLRKDVKKIENSYYPYDRVTAIFSRKNPKSFNRESMVISSKRGKKINENKSISGDVVAQFILMFSPETSDDEIDWNNVAVFNMQRPIAKEIEEYAGSKINLHITISEKCLKTLTYTRLECSIENINIEYDDSCPPQDEVNRLIYELNEISKDHEKSIIDGQMTFF